METLQEILIDGLKKYGSELIGAGLFAVSVWVWRRYHNNLYYIVRCIAYITLAAGVILMFYKYFSISAIVLLVLLSLLIPTIIYFKKLPGYTLRGKYSNHILRRIALRKGSGIHLSDEAIASCQKRLGDEYRHVNKQEAYMWYCLSKLGGNLEAEAAMQEIEDALSEDEKEETSSRAQNIGLQLIQKYLDKRFKDLF